MNLVKTTYLFLICFFITSCENIIMYHSYQHIPSNGWNKSDTITFHLMVNDSLTNDSTPGLYNLQLLVRNNTEYKYQHLSLYVENNFPDSTIWRKDTIRFEIADENGRWLGKGISGLYENSRVLDAVHLKNPHRFTFKIIPLMNDSILTGLNDIGVIAYKEKSLNLHLAN